MFHTEIKRRISSLRLLSEATLELTYKCNLDCFYCYNDREKSGKPLLLEHYRVLLEDLARMQTMFLMLTGGEPMVHPNFFEIGRIARDLGFVIRVRTNGHSLTSRIASRLRQEVEPYEVEVSLHGATAEVHDRQTRMPGSFERLINNIGTTTSFGLRMSVVTTPTKWNEHQIDEMFALCDSLEVPLRFQGPVAPRDNGDPTPLVIQPKESTWDHISKLVRERRRIILTKDNKAIAPHDAPGKEIEEAASCSIGVAGVDIDPYGNVQACMHLQKSAGNLHDQSIEEIWNNSPLFKRARSRAVSAAQHFQGIPIKQFGAPLYCLAVEENYNKNYTKLGDSGRSGRDS